jgi:putative hydrolase of the HAD superfamily
LYFFAINFGRNKEEIMKTLAYEQIIFDLGGVLIDIDYQATEKDFVELGLKDFGEKYSQLNQNDLFDKLEIGEISAQHFINKILTLCPVGTSPNKVVAAWNAMLGEFPKEKIELLQQIKGRLPIYMLSNTNEIHIPKVYDAWDKVSDEPMSALFDKIYLSFEIGKRKPDVSTFEWVCYSLKINPSTTLFIDDSPQHIEGAKKAGLLTYYYQSKTEFLEFFNKLLAD